MKRWIYTLHEECRRGLGRTHGTTLVTGTPFEDFSFHLIYYEGLWDPLPRVESLPS